jgi:hypothetical protein
VIYCRQQHYAAGRAELLQALQEARKREQAAAKTYWSLSPLLELGNLYKHGLNQRDKAQRYYGWCIALTEDGASPDVRADALVEMAELIASRGDSALAQHQAQEAITLYERMGKYSQKMTVVRFLETLERKF